MAQQMLVVDEVTCGLGSSLDSLHPFMPFHHPLPAARVFSPECTPLAFSGAYRAFHRSMGNVWNPLGEIWCTPSLSSLSRPALPHEQLPLSLLGPSTGGPLCPEPSLLAWKTTVHLQGLMELSLPQEDFS